MSCNKTYALWLPIYNEFPSYTNTTVSPIMLPHNLYSNYCVACKSDSIHLFASQSEPIIIMISHIMINQLYHIVSITDNRPKKLSYHLEIWYLDSENYHIISKVIFRFLKCIISYRNWYSNFKNYHIISKVIF